ncbi:Carboxymethylenebutenolidase [Vibrio aerogenes CECT 7868]|uniref:Carboxymethylenebutenolidase n=1 Tax=Vibrio aerogenes CECT 7868 TaxID=1216006 RepID=A0A1M5YYS2_9VIBR|nr:dienelactone hydrolase family protein [Vibrio aerogenes]SHI17202.1 Carboxymethylenebutenolidase [Vibrio aerogenes CECT 7868]
MSENHPVSTANSPESVIPQEAFDWYDEYAHGLIDRREFMQRLSGLAVLGWSMTALTAVLMPDYAQAEQVSFNDQRIKAEYMEFDSPNGHGKGRGYLVMPRNIDKKRPTILVIHENRGLNPYIKDVARRLAVKGYIAFAPDALFPLGGYPGNDDEGRAMQKSLDKGKIEQDFIAAARVMKALPQGNGQLGAVGFCFGGYIVNMLAATMPKVLNAAVPFYGTPAASSLRTAVKGPLLIHFAELDKRVNATWPDYEQQLKSNQADYVAHIYKQVNHGFHNDSTGRYNEPAAELAWQRTLDFFDSHLSG